MSQHHTQRSMGAQLERVKEMIVSMGGLQKIDREFGLAHFQALIAGRLPCSQRKARDYIDLIKRSSIAEARLKSMSDTQKSDARK